MICIYCSEDKGKDSFLKREHVIPQSFGKFKNNFTLHNLVCDECNSYFGNNLEIFIARDSYEGIMRYDFNIKKSELIKTMGKNSRLVVKIEDQPLKGAYAFRAFSKDQNRIVVKPIPQIGILYKNTNNYKFFLLGDIPDKGSLDSEIYDLKNKKGMIILGCDIIQAEDILNKKGFDFKPSEEEHSFLEDTDDLLCKVEWYIEDTIRRAVAKIAFNFLVYFMGVDFISHDSFKPIIQYIRFGLKDKYPLVIVDDQPILYDERRMNRSRLGHIVTFNWTSNGFSIVSQVSIFNMLRYSVSLAQNYTSIYKPFKFKTGRFFNVATGDILEMV